MELLWWGEHFGNSALNRPSVVVIQELYAVCIILTHDHFDNTTMPRVSYIQCSATLFMGSVKSYAAIQTSTSSHAVQHE